MSSGDDFYAEPMYTDMLEDISDVSQSHPIINRREECYKIHYHIKRGQLEWKGALLNHVWIFIKQKLNLLEVLKD